MNYPPYQQQKPYFGASPYPAPGSSIPSVSGVSTTFARVKRPEALRSGNGRGSSASESNQNCPSIALVIISLLLLLTSLILAVVAVLDPSWLVVDIREFRSEHHHGLYTDCTRAERIVPGGSSRRLPISGGNSDNAGLGTYEKSPLHCTYKFDENAAKNLEAQIHQVDSNAAAAEAEHHQFHGWHKAVLALIGLSLVAGCTTLLTGLCAPCSSIAALLHALFCFFALIFAISAATVFFFAAHRVDARFVQGLVGTYEQQIGEAFYCYLVNCILLLITFIMSLIGAYYSTRQMKSFDGRINNEQLAPLYAPNVNTINTGAYWRTAAV